jgi:hypothetical protein
MKRLLKIVTVNFVLLGFLLSLTNFASIATLRIYEWWKPSQYATAHLLPNYDGVAWAPKHFAEFQELSAEYEAYYGWRFLPYHGETINLDQDGFRRSYKGSEVVPNKTIAFFGGSTLFGPGALDDQTIPSYFVRMNPDFEAFNFGQHGFVAHQGFNLFLKRYFEGFRPDVVIFYDGINDVRNCRRDLDAYAHHREALIRRTMKEGSAEHPESFAFLLLPTKNLIEKLGRVWTNRTSPFFYDCDTNGAKAEGIANVMLHDWALVKNIVESYGGVFLAILQPNAHLSQTRKNHFKIDPEETRQYEAVYPIVVDRLHKEFAQLRENFVDLQRVLDTDEYVFYDPRHLSPRGNEIIAGYMLEAVAERTRCLEGSCLNRILTVEGARLGQVEEVK